MNPTEQAALDRLDRIDFLQGLAESFGRLTGSEQTARLMLVGRGVHVTPAGAAIRQLAANDFRPSPTGAQLDYVQIAEAARTLSADSRAVINTHLQTVRGSCDDLDDYLSSVDADQDSASDDEGETPKGGSGSRAQGAAESVRSFGGARQSILKEAAELGRAGDLVPLVGPTQNLLHEAAEFRYPARPAQPTVPRRTKDAELAEAYRQGRPVRSISRYADGTVRDFR